MYVAVEQDTYSYQSVSETQMRIMLSVDRINTKSISFRRPLEFHLCSPTTHDPLQGANIREEIRLHPIPYAALQLGRDRHTKAEPPQELPVLIPIHPAFSQASNKHPSDQPSA